MEWRLMPYKRHADFSGRSRRKEYRMFVLFTAIVYAICATLMLAGGFSLHQATGMTAPCPPLYIGSILLGLFIVGSFIPAIAVQVRRFHDQDKSSWLVLISFIPYIGGLIMLVFMCLEGTKGTNRFGPDPKDPAGGQVFS